MPNDCKLSVQNTVTISKIGDLYYVCYYKDDQNFVCNTGCSWEDAQHRMFNYLNGGNI